MFGRMSVAERPESEAVDKLCEEATKSQQVPAADSCTVHRAVFVEGIAKS